MPELKIILNGSINHQSELKSDLRCQFGKLGLENITFYLEPTLGIELFFKKSIFFFFSLGLIRDFLIIVPHHCKFHFSETLQILKHSILSNPDFRPFKLANAWMAMHKYASNLLSQPWRKEFTSIKVNIL